MGFCRNSLLLATFQAKLGVRFVSPGDGAPYGAMVFAGGGLTVADLGHKGSGFATPRDSATSGGNRQRARLWGVRLEVLWPWLASTAVEDAGIVRVWRNP